MSVWLLIHYAYQLAEVPVPSSASSKGRRNLEDDGEETVRKRKRELTDEEKEVHCMVMLGIR